MKLPKALISFLQKIINNPTKGKEQKWCVKLSAVKAARTLSQHTCGVFNFDAGL